MKKIKVKITPVLDSDKMVSFKLNSNIDIFGLQFKLNGFGDDSFYRFGDIGTIKNTLKLKPKTKYKWNQKSIVEIYDFTVSVNSHKGMILAFNLSGNAIRAGHSHLFSIPIIKTENGKKLKKYCIKDLVISDKNGKNIVEGKKNIGRCIDFSDSYEINKKSLTNIQNKPYIKEGIKYGNRRNKRQDTISEK